MNFVNCFIKFTILNNMIWLQISDGFSCSFSTLFSFLKCSANPLKNQGDRASKFISWNFFLSTKMINESKMIFFFTETNSNLSFCCFVGRGDFKMFFFLQSSRVAHSRSNCIQKNNNDNFHGEYWHKCNARP